LVKANRRCRWRRLHPECWWKMLLMTLKSLATPNVYWRHSHWHRSGIAPCQHICRAVVDDAEVVVESPHRKVGKCSVIGCQIWWQNLIGMFAKVLVVTPRSVVGASNSKLWNFECRYIFNSEVGSQNESWW
jgi:hypothetical protein